jgi:GT2 family glycosyltransferase
MSEERIGAKPGPSLSIIIVTYNPGGIIADCLRSLQEGARGLSYEVIVVDNASQDGTPERIAQEYPQAQMIANKDNRGFAAANNQGLALAVGHYVLLLNPDVMVHPGALSAMVAFLEENSAAGIVGPRTFDGEGNVALTARPPYSVVTVLWQYLGLSRLLPNHVYGQYRKACRDADSPFEPAWLQGSCLMLRREVYEQVGGLDEQFFLFAEETDFCDRAAGLGWRVAFIPHAHVTHYESSSVSRYIPIKVRSHHISPLHYFRKRGREGAVWLLKFGYTIELLGKVIIRLAQLVWRRNEELALRVRVYWAVLGESWRY